MTDEPDLAAMLLDNDYGLRLPPEATKGFATARALATRRLLELRYDANGELGDYFDMRKEL